MLIRLEPASLRIAAFAALITVGAAMLPGCGGQQGAPVDTPGGAPIDNDEAERQKAMEDYMNQQSKKK